MSETVSGPPFYTAAGVEILIPPEFSSHEEYEAHLRRDLELALKDNANYRATIQRLMRDARLKDAVVEAARARISELERVLRGYELWETDPQAALDAAQQQPQHASTATDDAQS